MSKIRKISGFPEWLPEQRLFEEQVIEKIRAVFKRAGFMPLETSAVELLSTLSAKGAVDKEIYTLRRLHAEDTDREKEELALHFDLTVPFSRFVAQNFSQLIFPFKRYQVQKVWRGERPQKGRYREFYQFDIDIISRDDLPIACDAEALDVYSEAISLLGLPAYELRVNDRKILLGFYAALGLSEEQQKKTISIVDKIDKIGRDKVAEQLGAELGLAAATVDRIVGLTEKRLKPSEAIAALKGFDIDHPQFQKGVEDLTAMLDLLNQETLSRVVVDLSLARGLDYYTGFILEVRMVDYPEYGSVGSGGRYEDLASEFITQKLPGVGFSIGLTRILGFLFEQKLVEQPRASTTQVLVSVYNEAQRQQCNQVATELRRAGVATEVYYKSPKLGKQLDFADAKKIPYVLFIAEDGKQMQVKDLRSKDQFTIEDLKAFAARIEA